MGCVAERDTVHIRQGLADDGVYSKVLDQTLSSPLNVTRDEKAGACQVESSLNDIGAYGEKLARN
jgi:hypothetical protein